MRIRSQMLVFVAVGMFALSEAHAGNITTNGNCNIILNNIIDSQISIQSDCTISSGDPRENQIPSVQGGQPCRCTTRKSFVRRLEDEIVRMSRGIGELPGYDNAFDMLNGIVRQVPVCCHRAILTDVTQADKVSCKVKLISRAWLDTPEQGREDIISSAARAFRENKLDVCNLISSDQ